MLNLGMSDSHFGLFLQPPSHPATGPKVSFQLTQIFLCQEPINLEIVSDLIPWVSTSSEYPYTPCPLLRKIKPHLCTGDCNYFKSLFIHSKPAPTSVQFSSSFSFMMLHISLWTLFCPNLSDNFCLIIACVLEKSSQALKWTLKKLENFRPRPCLWSATRLSYHICWKAPLSLTGHSFPCAVRA